MARYIDADRLINEISGNGGVFVYGPQAVSAIVSRINVQPTADVAEVKHGHWMDNIKTISTVGTPNIKALVGYKCSLCGRAEVCKEPYCNCGAKMDERRDT